MLKSAFLSPQIIAAFLGGGLAGAIFTWFVNLPQPTVVTYTRTVTALEESEVTSIIPNLKIQVGDERVKAVYVHLLNFEIHSGPYIDSLNVAITFPDKARIFGKASRAPSPVHHIGCESIMDMDGVLCAMAPITRLTQGFNNYQVTLATDQKRPPVVVTAAKNVELLEASLFQARKKWPIPISAPALLAMSLSVILYFVVFPVLFFRRTRRVHPGLAQVIRTVDGLEKRLPFVAVPYLFNKIFISSPDRQKDLEFALSSGMLKTYSVQNPKNPAHPITACKLNRDHPLVKLVL